MNQIPRYSIFLSLTLLLACTSGPSWKRLHTGILTVDTHCDTPMKLVRHNFDMGMYHAPGAEGSGQIDFPRMKEGGLDAEFFAVFTGQGPRTKERHEKIKQFADEIIDSLEAACARYSDMAEIAVTPAQAYKLEKQGRIAAFIGMENGYPIGTDLANVAHFYNRGVRYITLCHNGNNEICDSSTDDPEWDGLSPFGEKVVKEMNRLGMIIDVSHVSDSTFYDVIRLSEAPVIASHSSCRALCDHPRDMTDDMIQTLAEHGGVIQLCLVSSFVKTPKPNKQRDAAFDSLRNKYGDYNTIKDETLKETYRNAYYAVMKKYPRELATVKDLADHVDHVVQLAGIDHVGIGSDFDGGGGLDGCNDVTEFPNITKELIRRGYSKTDIEKIWGKNVMRVFSKVIETSKNRG